MRMRMLVFALVLAAPAAAHDLWVEGEGDALVLQRGHLHSGHAGEGRVSYPPEQVQSVLCAGEAGEPVPAQVERAYPLRVRGPCAALYVVMSSGYWTKTPEGTKNQPKTAVAQPLRAWQSFESVKHLVRWSPGLARALGGHLEIVAESDPSAVAEGDKLRVRVLRDGRPVAGATVTYDGKVRGTTGEDGGINLRLRHGGLQRIQAGLNEPHEGPQADEVTHTTTLSFELGTP